VVFACSYGIPASRSELPRRLRRPLCSKCPSRPITFAGMWAGTRLGSTNSKDDIRAGLSGNLFSIPTSTIWLRKRDRMGLCGASCQRAFRIIASFWEWEDHLGYVPNQNSGWPFSYQAPIVSQYADGGFAYVLGRRGLEALRPLCLRYHSGVLG